MKRMALVMAIALSVAFLAAWIAWTHKESSAPLIPTSIAPVNGTIIEYWPNRKVRSERVYRDGSVHEAVFYSSNGQLVFEMASDR